MAKSDRAQAHGLVVRTLRNPRRALALLAIGVGAACSTPPSPGGTSEGPAPESHALVALTRSVQPMAKRQWDIGRRDPSLLSAGSIYFQPTAAQKADRDALVAAVQDPTSPSFHKWITPEQFAARFGAQPSDIARVTAWLKEQGLTIDAPSPLATRVAFRGTTGQVEAAFHTEFHDYLIGGKKHFAMASAPRIPAELAPVVMGLRGFHDFLPVPNLRHKPKPQFTDPNFGLTLGPDDFATIYDTKPLLNSGTDGTGINIAIIGQTWIDPTDLTAFRTQFGLTAHETDICIPGSGDCQTISPNGDQGEAELDLEWSSAVARGANILYVYAGADFPAFTVNDAAVYIVEKGTKLAPGVGNGGAQIMSESYGGCDLFVTTTDADIESEIAAAANLEGITYVASSGDSGAAGCYEFGVGGLYTGSPADLPGVTAVGGTEFFPNVQTNAAFWNQTTNVALAYPNSNTGVSLEAVWNDSVSDGSPSGGGGAPSIIFPKPAYQIGLTPSDGARDVPDVSLTASADNVGYECYEGGLTPIGGTSASAPSFAGILAMVNQAVVAHGGPHGLGNANPMLYTLFQSNGTLKAFHDIVTGDNIVPCTVGTDPDCPASGSYGGFSAVAGYDLATGLGTIDAAKLVAAWDALTPTTTLLTAPASAGVGTKITLTANIASAAIVNGIGGTVTFTFETFTGADAGPVYGQDAGGVPDESWVLGTAAVNTLVGTPETASAQLSAAIPPGLFGKAYVVAMYNGDTHYLASHSEASLVTITGSNLVIDPTAATIAPFGHKTFSTSGGAPPVTWSFIGTDTTCDANFNCTFVEPQTPTQGYVQAGGTAGGTVILVATDTNGEEAIAKITVTGAPVDAGTFPTFDAGPPGGPGNPPLADSGAALPDAGSLDSGILDAGHDSGTTADAGHDGGTTADAGHDSGSGGTDSGSDGAVGDDGGTTGDDSGSTGDDSGSTGDDDSGTAGDDSGTSGDDGGITLPPGDDSGAVASGDAAAEGGSGSGGSGDSSGCGCVTAGSRNDGTSTGSMGGVLLGLAAIVRRRRNRR